MRNSNSILHIDGQSKRSLTACSLFQNKGSTLFIPHSGMIHKLLTSIYSYTKTYFNCINKVHSLISRVEPTCHLIFVLILPAEYFSRVEITHCTSSY